MKTKICTTCGYKKEISEFYKSITGKFGVRAICKICENEYAKIYHQSEVGKEVTRKAQRKYQQTKSYKEYRHSDTHKEARKKYRQNNPWKIIFQNINKRCNNPNAINYCHYGGRGIKNLFKNSDEIKELWFRDRAYEMKRPSIHRIDNDGNYCIKNCKFIEWKEHIKSHRVKIVQF